MKGVAFNPYLPPWEYIPDAEPYVFEGRVYVYGSHDFYNGFVFCMGDYVCWSAPVDDLSDWRYEGVIYPRDADPMNRDGSMCLYAPDVTQGPDGRYYLYYVLDHARVVSAAVCDTPAGRYEFLGYVRYPDGTRLGDRPGDEPQFDPGVLTEGERTYLYTGFCMPGDKSRHGAMATVLGPDMLTVQEGPAFVLPGPEYAQGTGFEEHAFFEAPSIRRRGDTYYLVYSSTAMHELCYAASDDPLRGFRYGGVVVSNCDLHIDTYKPADKVMAFGGNNHGGIVEIQGKWYIFWHRHTNGTWFSRQACAEPIAFLPDGSIPQAEITSCGLNGGPLPARGEYPAWIACHLFTEEGMSMYAGAPRQPRVMQDGSDRDPGESYIGDIRDGTTAGFKHFDCRGVRGVRIRTRAYMDGVFEVKTSWDGEALARIPVRNSNVWAAGEADVRIPDGTHSLYLTYRGTGEHIQLRSLEFLT
ncbi:MAG TPA: family 43 glycosylhydrolase [Candidatus Limnocylindria bacterium]|nr:family 43 glycosylhydrolase [Candidatus Limnocylindria bacterium]